jgi:hypothetical protein
MKKVIEGKTYNTETAELLGTWSNHYGSNDFKHCTEELYKTGKGQFFVYGEGGPMSRWGQSYGNSTSGGDGILLLTETEAQGWAEAHLTATEYIKVFGEIEG